MHASYHTRSAVLFVIFNRPDTTAQVFNAIRTARPPKLYIAADGPRLIHNGEAEICAETRAIAQQIDWPCDIKTLYRQNNLGCKEAVAGAISWFFDNEEEGIILEDDCLPANSFFYYCDTLLQKYRHDTRITHIGGSNLQLGKVRGNASYYFSNLTHVWGWAGWRRVWQTYDKELTRYQQSDVQVQLSNVFTDPFILFSWEEIFKQVKSGVISTWDYQLTFANFFNNGLSVIPNVNLISNIGYGVHATNTPDPLNPFANIPLGKLEYITHPLYVLPSKAADIDTLSRDFNLETRYKKHNKLHRRIKRWLKRQ